MATIDEAMTVALGHHQAGQLNEAANIYRQIVAVDVNHVEAWHLLGVAACQAGELNMAEQCIGRALALWPGHVDAHNSLGLTLKQMGRLDEAARSCRRAIELNPAIGDAHYNLGNILQSQGKLDEAAASLRRAVELKPGDPAFHNNLGNVLREGGAFDEAAECFRRALALDPTWVEAHVNQAALWLLQGDFGRGWEEYEWRWKTTLRPPRNAAKPLWNGEPLDGKTILVRAEQGLGDTFQFIRYAKPLKSLATIVLVEEKPQMLSIISSCEGIDRTVASGGQLPSYDVEVPLLSLPRILRTTLATIPAATPYLFAEADLVGRWREALRGISGFRVGINWRGRERQGEFRKRDIPLEMFESLGTLSGVRLISLQKDSSAGTAHQSAPESAVGEAHPPIVDLGPDVDAASGAFMDTAAIIKNLDLVITSDTAVAHLAGALGAPVWVALPYVPDWRWLLERSDSPWYPTMRLFRQKVAGDWKGVFREIETALRAAGRGERPG